MMPGSSTSSANSSGEHLKDMQTAAGSRTVTAYILPPILKTKSPPHCTFSVVWGSERQNLRTHSTFIWRFRSGSFCDLDHHDAMRGHIRGELAGGLAEVFVRP